MCFGNERFCKESMKWMRFAIAIFALTTAMHAQDRVARGREVFLTRTCAMCHAIQGTGSFARVGPDLTHLASRPRIAAGMFPNNPGYLAGWILNPRNLKPGTKMPATLLTSEELDALMAFLATLK